MRIPGCSAPSSSAKSRRAARTAMGRRKPGWYRARQKGLLGEALRVVPRDGQQIAAAAREILSNPALYEEMAAAGRARMGPPGASARMADAIIEQAPAAVGAFRPGS
ncbi:MAG: hypothetical protein ACYCW6_06340 [Candidatus Xenobia bacterium]